jgi:dipeptidyl-peptidase-4
MKHLLLLTILTAVSSSMAQEIPDALLTVAERSKFQATSKHAEVVTLCEQLAKASPRIKLVAEAGTTKEGRKQPLLILADPPVSTPAEANKTGKVIVMAFANIHAGEVDGKEGVLMLARELGLATSHPLFKNVVFLVYPNLNADGNDRFKLDNRPGQDGPAEGMGIRRSADGLDLNRDFVTLDSPEVRCLVKLFDQWNPHIIVDMHTTNGSYHRHTITYDVNKHPTSDAALIELANDKMIPELNKSLEKRGWLGFYYGNFNRDRTVWSTYGFEPRFSTQYCALRQRIGILSESYSYASYKDRVLASRDFVYSILDYAAKHRAEVIKTLQEVEDRQRTGEHTIALKTKEYAKPQRYTVQGYAEKEENGKRVRTQEPKEYAVSYIGWAEATLSVKRPVGYLIPVKYASALENLKRHGIAMEPAAAGEFVVEAYTVKSFQHSQSEFQKHLLLATMETSVASAKRTVSAQEYMLVKCSQPLGNLASYLLEPHAKDGLAVWNYFDAGLKVGEEFPVLRVVK